MSMLPRSIKATCLELKVVLAKDLWLRQCGQPRHAQPFGKLAVRVARVLANWGPVPASKARQKQH